MCRKTDTAVSLPYRTATGRSKREAEYMKPSGPCVIAFVLCIATGAFGQTAGELNKQGVELYNSGEYERAAQLIERALRLVPGNSIVEQNLVNCYLQVADKCIAAGDHSAALDWVTSAIDIKPDDPDLYVRAGSSNIKVKNLNAAEGNLRAALELDLGNVNAHTLLGEVLYSTGDLAGAIAEWEAVLEAAPDREDVRSRLEKARREVKVEGNYSMRQSRRFLLTYERSELRTEANRVLRMLDRIWYKVGRDMRYWPEPGAQVPVVLYTPDKFFDATGAGLHVSALYDGKIRVPIGPQTEDNDTLELMLTHEYTHVVVRLITNNNVPFWLNEGLAQYESETFEARHRQLIERAIGRETVIPLDKLDGPQIKLLGSQLRLAYAEGFAAVRFIRRKFGMRKLLALLERLGEGYSTEDAMALTLKRGYTYTQLQADTFREFMPAK